MITIVVVVVFIVRLVFLKKSMRNEKAILEAGGREYGVQNTKRLTLLHILFYLSCVIEALVYQSTFDRQSVFGLTLLVFSMGMLCFVTHILGKIWTVKLMVLREHPFIDHWLFRFVKHPNYFLNIIPELVGLALLCHAMWSFILIFPAYLYVLLVRIREENQLLREIIIPQSQMQTSRDE